MGDPNVDLAAIIRNAALLLEEETTILASPEDAAFFRARPVKAPPAHQPSTEAPYRASVQKHLQITTERTENTEKKKAPLPAQPLPEPPPQPQRPRPASQFRSILEKVAPSLAILDAIPDDTAAKQIANRWKTKNQSAPISILSSGELPQHKALLSEIAAALDVFFGPARLIEADALEKEKQWDVFLSTERLKLVVICDSTLWQLSALRQFYKETPAAGIRMLKTIPVFLLPDLSLYLKDPLLKRSLWKALLTRIANG